MYTRISKKIFLKLILENGNKICTQLIKNIFDYMCQNEEAKFEYSFKVKAKIKSTLVYLKKMYHKIKRNGSKARKKFHDMNRNQFVELNVELPTNDLMDVDPITIDLLFNQMTI